MAGTDFAEPDDFAVDSCDAFSAPGGKKDFGALFGFSSLPRLLSFGFPKPLPQTFLCFLTAAQLHWPALPPYVGWLVGFHLLLELVLLV